MVQIYLVRDDKGWTGELDDSARVRVDDVEQERRRIGLQSVSVGSARDILEPWGGKRD